MRSATCFAFAMSSAVISPAELVGFVLLFPQPAKDRTPDNTSEATSTPVSNFFFIFFPSPSIDQRRWFSGNYGRMCRLMK
jgi:hypothetical protein